MLLISIHIMLFISKGVSMYDIEFSNQKSECAIWVANHVFINNEFHLEDEDNSIYISFQNFNQLSDTKCENVSIRTEYLLLNAETKVLIEKNLNLTEVLNLVSFSDLDGDVTLE